MIWRAAFQSAVRRRVSPSLRAMRWTCVSVGIDEAGSRDAAPQPEVEVVAPDHPAQVEVPALARRARRRARKEEAHGGALGQPPDAEDRTVVEGLDARDGAREQGPGVPILGALRALEEAAQAASAGLAGAGDREEERGRVARAVEAVAEPGQGVGGELPEAPDAVQGPGGPGTERGEQPAHVGLDDGHLAVGEGRRDPTHDLSILGIGIAADEDDRVRGHGLRPVAPVQARRVARRGERAFALAIPQSRYNGRGCRRPSARES